MEAGSTAKVWKDGRLQDASLAHHLHGVTGTLWIVLIALQGYLAGSRRLSLHRATGFGAGSRSGGRIRRRSPRLSSARGSMALRSGPRRVTPRCESHKSLPG